MRGMWNNVLRSAAVVAVMTGLLAGGEAKAADGDSNEFYADWIAGHVDVGVRFTDYALDRTSESDSDTEEYFIGSIDTLKEDDRGMGMHNIYFTWFPLTDSSEWLPEGQRDNWKYLFMVIRGFGVELTWDHVRGKTWTSAAHDGTEVGAEYSDGTVVAKGRMLSFVLKMDNSTRITPYIGLGTVDYSDVSVTGYNWWHWGFGSDSAQASYDEWVASGSTTDPNGGVRRTFTVDSGKGDVWFVGATVDVYENWQVEVYYRQTEVVLDNAYDITDNGIPVMNTRSSKWDLSHKAYGLGVRYAF